MKDIIGTTRLCALLGNPTGHSLSPMIHNNLASSTKTDMAYTTFSVEKEALEDALLAYEGTVLVISHDRYFLNKIAVKILDMHKDYMKEYLGNYDYYVEKLKEESMEDEKKIELTQTQIKKQEKKMKK